MPLYLLFLYITLVYHFYVNKLQYSQYTFQDFCFRGGCYGQAGGTTFHVGMTGADQHRYLRPDE